MACCTASLPASSRVACCLASKCEGRRLLLREAMLAGSAPGFAGLTPVLSEKGWLDESDELGGQEVDAFHLVSVLDLRQGAWQWQRRAGLL